MSLGMPRGPDVEAELSDRLRDLTGLGCSCPPSAAQPPSRTRSSSPSSPSSQGATSSRLKAGFGGKTLFALTGTANPSYKKQIDPLYADVHYVDPFAPDAAARIDALLEAHEFAVVQVELIQSVGGVRAVPDA